MYVKTLTCKRTGEYDAVKDHRIAFAVIGDVIYMQSAGDYRPMHEAIEEELDITTPLLGGYVDISNIVFFNRNGHGKPDKAQITSDIIIAIWKEMQTAGEVAVWSGVISGEPGELWPTDELIGYMSKQGSYHEI